MRFVDDPLRPQLGDGVPTRMRSVVRMVVPVVVAVQTLTALDDRLGSTVAALVVLLVALTAAWAVLINRRHGDAVDAAMLLVVVASGAALHAVTHQGQVYVVSYAALFIAPFWYAMPAALLVSAAAWTAITVETILVGNYDLLGGLGTGVGAFFFALAARFWGRVLRTSERNAALVAELRESRAAEAASAVVAERARLARELHDVLAHTLSSLALHLQTTRVLARSNAVDPEVQERIEQAAKLARAGLDEARSAVGALRDDELPGPERLVSLVTDFRRHTGLPCDLSVRGHPRELAPESRVALFRTAQEALTNVGKHAVAERVEVALDWLPGVVELRVENVGGPTGNGLAMSGGSGHGLRGMRERAELAGGELRAGPTGHGFCVQLRLPTEDGS